MGIINPTEYLVHFAARCPVCKKYYDITVDISKKLATNDGRIVCCSSKKCRHAVLNWISPFSVRDVTLHDLKKGQVLSKP